MFCDTLPVLKCYTLTRAFGKWVLHTKLNGELFGGKKYCKKSLREALITAGFFIEKSRKFLAQRARFFKRRVVETCEKPPKDFALQHGSSKKKRKGGKYPLSRGPL